MFNYHLTDILLLKVPGTLSLLSASLLLFLTALCIWATDGSRPFWRSILIAFFCWAASTFIAPLTVGFGVLEFSAQLLGAIGAGFAYAGLIDMRPHANIHEQWSRTKVYILLCITITIATICVVNYKHSAALLMLMIGIYPIALAFTVTSNDSSLSERERAMIQTPFILASATQTTGLWYWIYPSLKESWQLPLPPDMMLPISTTLTASGCLTLLSIFLSGDVKYFQLRREAISQRRNRIAAELWGSGPASRTSLLTATLIHELKQPLTTITTALDLYKNAAVQNEENLSIEKELIALIRTSTVQASDILKHAHETQSITAEPVDLKTIFDDIGTQFSVLRSSKVQINFESSKSQPTLRSDPIRVQQILTNLIRNSINIMNDNAGEINIRSWHEANEVKVQVHDTGPGFPLPLLENELKPHQIITTSSHGLGLGLLISHRLATSIGGKLSLSNPDSGGAMATLSIPLDPPATEDYAV